jgi:hypothetical protein
MKIFFDTSTFVKRYVKENGSIEVLDYFNQAQQVLLSSIYKIEFYSAINRRVMEKSIKENDLKILLQEFMFDEKYFDKIPFSDDIELISINVVKKYKLKTLDSIHLASAIYSEIDIFLTSDKKLFQAAELELKNKVVFIN